MSNTIVSIEERFELNINSKDGGRYTADGYVILLSDGTEILIAIDNSGQCCENWGYVTSEDDITSYIGARVLSVNVVEDGTANTVAKLPKGKGGLDYDGAIMFLNVDTSRGLLQFTVYNDHNGYYGHMAVVKVGKNVLAEGEL